VDTVHECDRRTDGRTDRITITRTVQRKSSHGKKHKLNNRPLIFAPYRAFSVMADSMEPCSGPTLVTMATIFEQFLNKFAYKST